MCIIFKDIEPPLKPYWPILILADFPGPAAGLQVPAVRRAAAPLRAKAWRQDRHHFGWRGSRGTLKRGAPLKKGGGYSQK